MIRHKKQKFPDVLIIYGHQNYPYNKGSLIKQKVGYVLLFHMHSKAISS